MVQPGRVVLPMLMHTPHKLIWTWKMRATVGTLTTAGIILFALGVGCAQSSQGAPDAGASQRQPVSAPDGQGAVEVGEGGERRTLRREAATEVVVDEALFRPYLLSEGAPRALREAHVALAAEESSKARARLEAFLIEAPEHALAPQVGFILATLERDAGKHKAAAKRFEALSESYPLLSDHASFLGAQSAFAAGRHAQAIRLCTAIPMSSPFGSPSKHLRARALLKLDKAREGIEVLEELVEARPRARATADVRLHLAGAYEASGRAVEAVKIYQALRMRYPGRYLEREAEAGIKRLRGKLSKVQARRLLTPSPRDRVRRAEALQDVHRSQQVIDEMKALSRERGVKTGSDVWCDAMHLEAYAHRKLRRHDDAANAFALYLKGCPEHGGVLKALYSSARSLWTVDRDKEALVAFERVWTEFPQHSYADDAVLYAARIHRGNDNDAEMFRLLDFQVRTFPRGDMLGSAHWMRVVELIQSDRHVDVVAAVDKIGEATGEVDIYTRGRLAYFRARSLEQLGRRDQALKGFEAVVEAVPMSYYALLALNRMRVLDAGRFEARMSALARQRGEREVWTIEPPEVASDRRFKRGLELLRLGLLDRAKGEFDRLRAHYKGHEQVLWSLTLLFDRAGAYHLSHNIPRREIGSFGASWPTGRSLDMFLLAYPRPYHDAVAKWARTRKISEALAYAIMREESGFNARIESWANAYGLMQLILPTAKQMASADGLKRPTPKRLKGEHLMRPELNIRLGTRFLSELSAAYGHHPAVTIAGYNGGFGNVDRWLKARGDQPLDLWVEEIPFGQTRHYTKRVLTSLWTYQWLYGATGQDAPVQDRLILVPLKLPAPSR